MPAEGFIQVHAYTSTAQLPLEGVAIAITDAEGRLLAARLTNSSGQIKPVAVSVPAAADSRDPDFKGQPFTTVNIRAQHPDYEQIQADQIQAFAGVTTLQPLEMIPISLYPESFDQVEKFLTPPQNL